MTVSLPFSSSSSYLPFPLFPPREDQRTIMHSNRYKTSMHHSTKTKEHYTSAHLFTNLRKASFWHIYGFSQQINLWFSHFSFYLSSRASPSHPLSSSLHSLPEISPPFMRIQPGEKATQDSANWCEVPVVGHIQRWGCWPRRHPLHWSSPYFEEEECHVSRCRMVPTRKR